MQTAIDFVTRNWSFFVSAAGVVVVVYDKIASHGGARGIWGNVVNGYKTEKP